MINILRKYKVKIEVCSSIDEIATKVASNYINQVKNKPKSVLGFATGSTPIPTYQKIVLLAKTSKTSFKEITSFNLDEYIDLDQKFSHESYRNFMNSNLFDHLDINKAKTFFPTKENPIKYDKLIKNLGGIDLQILGLGVNGHIAFNEPGTCLFSKTHVVNITESTRQANSRFFNNDINLVPKLAVTMGINTILKSKKIILIATGENKSDAILKLHQGKFTKKWPCTALLFHKDVTVYVDQAAAKKIK